MGALITYYAIQTPSDQYSLDRVLVDHQAIGDSLIYIDSEKMIFEKVSEDVGRVSALEHLPVSVDCL